MDDKEVLKNDEVEVDLSRIFRAVIDRAWLVAIIAVLCAVITFAGTFFLVTPEYQSTAKSLTDKQFIFCIITACLLLIIRFSIQ